MAITAGCDDPSPASSVSFPLAKAAGPSNGNPGGQQDVLDTIQSSLAKAVLNSPDVNWVYQDAQDGFILQQ